MPEIEKFPAEKTNLNFVIEYSELFAPQEGLEPPTCWLQLPKTFVLDWTISSSPNITWDGGRF